LICFDYDDLDRERRSSTTRIPQSLLAWLLDEISDDGAFEAEPEPSTIISPVGVDGSWDGFDNFIIRSGGIEALFADNRGLREELSGILRKMGSKLPR
jgi:hypothetical protein